VLNLLLAVFSAVGCFQHPRCSTEVEAPIPGAVAAPSLAVSEARLDGALSSLVWWKVSLLMAGGLEPDDL